MPIQQLSPSVVKGAVNGMADDVGPGVAPDWDALAKRYDRTIWLRLLALRVPVDRAHDLKQEVWETLIRKWQQGQLPYLQMPGLALRQADFVVRQSWRRAQREGSGNVVELSDKRVAALAGDAEHLVLKRARLQRAFAMVQEGSSTSRQVFTLTYRPPGMTAAEVARRLNLSEQRVRQVLCELRARLRRQL